MFFVKTFSPFARAYAPALAQLPNPISQEEFLAFIDGLNRAFLSSPAFQALHVAGGLMLNAQGVIPVQAVGIALNIGSIAATAAVSMIRTASYLKKANTRIFNPSGLTVQLMSTKKMMDGIGFENVGENGKLKLSALNEPKPLEAYKAMAFHQSGLDDLTSTGCRDPRTRRLHALSHYIAPLTFEVPEETHGRGWIVRKAEAPLKWLGNKQFKKLDKTIDKVLIKREEKAIEVEAQTSTSQEKFAAIEAKAMAAQEHHKLQMLVIDSSPEERALAQTRAAAELNELEEARCLEMQTRDQAIANIYKDCDKKLRKAYRKEEKIANRILWIVIRRTEAVGSENVVRVETETTEETRDGNNSL